MRVDLRYGTGRCLQLEIDPQKLISACGTPDAPTSDPNAATAEALRKPLDYPPLDQATVPGDRVVLPMSQGIPGAAEVLAAVVTCLVGRGVSPADITLLVAGPAGEREASRLVPDAYRGQVQVELHDPDSREHFSYLGVDQEGETIYLNRTLCDADVVVPIVCQRCAADGTSHGVFDGLFPAFTHRKAQDQLAAKRLSRSPKVEENIDQRVDQVGRMLGVQFIVEVVGGADGQVLRVVAGDPTAATHQALKIFQEAWTFAIPRPAQLVVAAIGGPPDEQTWENAARALSAAARVVDAGGSIALCTTIVDPPGPAVRKFSRANDPAAALRQLRRNPVSDSLAAAAIVQVMTQTRIYLMSNLDAESVEKMGMIPLADQAELGRLIAQSSTCIVLANAQYTVANLD